MNRGEGLRYAANAKSTTINLFKEKEKKKPKKFGYKNRGQQFSVRKVQENTADHPPSNKPTATKPHTTNTKNDKKAATTASKGSTKDFVRKNAQAATSGKGKEKKKATAAPSTGGGSTVTLTQDQLNAILATIGASAGSGGGIPNISLANGTINVDTQNEEPHQRLSAEKSHDVPTPETQHNKSGGEDISALIAKGNDTSEAQGKYPHSPNTQTINAEHRDVESHEYQSGNPHINDENNNNERTHKRPGVASNSERKPPSGVALSGMGYGDVSSIIGDDQRTLAKKKKQQWKKDLDEQIAMNRQQQGTSDKSNRVVRGSRGGPKADDQSSWSPWGQPGSGAPNTNVSLDLSAVTSADMSDGLPMQSKSRKEPTSSRITPRDVSSSLGKMATEKYTPAAMRSSFIIGGDAIDSHNMTVKQREKKRWLEDLEQQRRDAKERKEQDKRKQQEMDNRLTSHWAEPVTSPRSKPAAPPVQSQVKPKSTVDDFEVKKETRAHRVSVSPPRHHSADAVQSGRQDDSATEHHVRPSGLLVDPVEAERQEQKRQKHLEHMLAVKEQVEERQRLKREAMEAKKREEAEEEAKLAAERDMLQKQFDMEKEKQRKKEEEAAAKQKAMQDSVKAAYESAQHEKHQKRVQRLQSHGHDVNNLRRSWEAKHNSPETSPRHQPNPVETSPRLQSMNHHPVRHSPHLDPITTPHTLRQSVGLDQSPKEPVVTHDMATSPVFDQAVQTDFQFSPSAVVKEQTFNFEREGSAGIEYKPDKQQKRKKDGQKKVKGQEKVDKGQDRTVKIQDKSKKVTKTKEVLEDDDVTSKRTNKDKPRPIWGQTNKTKKKVGNTQKDLTGNKKKREERRRQRMEEMMALQERSAPKRLTEKKKSASVPHSRTASGLDTRSNSTTQDVVKGKKANCRAATDVDLRRERKTSNAWTDDSKESADLPSSPPLRNGDFVPFLRHDEEIDERSIPGSPSVSRYSQHDHSNSIHGNKTRDVESKTVTPRQERSRLSSIDKKDPLLNPERLKDSNLRQEKILEQLSNLRQGLMMKQRELEMGLSTSTPLIR